MLNLKIVLYMLGKRLENPLMVSDVQKYLAKHQLVPLHICLSPNMINV